MLYFNCVFGKWKLDKQTLNLISMVQWSRYCQDVDGYNRTPIILTVVY